MALVPPKLKFTGYFVGKFTIRALVSERFAAKSRARREDIESRRDWATDGFNQVLGDVRVLSPPDIRGREIELSATCSWNPCLAIIRLKIRGYHMDVAVRPPPVSRLDSREFIACYVAQWRDSLGSPIG